MKSSKLWYLNALYILVVQGVESICISQFIIIHFSYCHGKTQSNSDLDKKGVSVPAAQD